ncbi:MAG: TlpA disulfide reductase family protein [Nitrospirota bacterium]
MRNKKPVFLLLGICLFAFFFHGFVTAEVKPPGAGDPFPDLIFKDTLSKEQRLYLGIPKKKSLSFRMFQGELFLLEIFNTFCTSCPRNVPIFNDIYLKSKKDPSLKGKIRVISIAIGNTSKEVELYRKEQKVLYPILTDYEFAAHKALGTPRVPFTIIVEKDTQGKYTVAYSHQGVHENIDEIMCKIRDLLKQPPSRQ